MRPTRDTAAGQAYLDLQNRARREGRGTQQLLTLYVVECWLARLSRSRYAHQFILKGGMLLAAFDARGPTADADALARGMASDEITVVGRVAEIAAYDADDGVEFLTGTVTARRIRDEARYGGLRITMDARIATANVKFRLDVNFGDPVTPGPQRIELPSLRTDAPSIRMLGYPIETVLAEKIATAITLGPANTRVRDFADVYTLTGRHDLTYAVMREALLTTAAFRATALTPLSSTLDNLIELRVSAYRAYRSSLGPDGDNLPDDFADVVAVVAAFADPLIDTTRDHISWQAAHRRWR